MPAVQQRSRSGSLIEHLADSARVPPVNNIIPLKHYYRSVDLLLSQVKSGVGGVSVQGSTWLVVLVLACHQHLPEQLPPFLHRCFMDAGLSLQAGAQ